MCPARPRPPKPNLAMPFHRTPPKPSRTSGVPLAFELLFACAPTHRGLAVRCAALGCALY
ncbi:hypothetical protein VFPBJ_08109 [Purpureocillium lilacinum]|uniref:Uncharacterized protein n=1 Tax=Purpureocillium lilacinum TaxID=33203 RepID=A0A179GIE2_PURLI|nr:hypothetical protein VFPBJ_08109 [Purpureocillium lilacinum]